MTEMDIELDTNVLIVDDDEDVADTYALWLKEYGLDVATAHGGDEALERLQPAVDIILLDRRMPRIPGDVVLREARKRTGTYQISMLTAVEPDESVLDLAYDEYLVKPVTKADVVDAVERLALRKSLDADLRELFRLATKESTLQAHGDDATDEAAAALQDDIDAKQATLHEKLRQLDQAQDVFALIERQGL